MKPKKQNIMKKIIFLIAVIAAMTLSVSVSAQGYYAPHRLPARGYANPYARPERNYHEPQRGHGYNRPVRKAAYVASEVLRCLVIADRIFAPYCTSEYYDRYFDSREPDRWVAGRRGMPYWPRYMNNKPFRYYGTGCGNTVFYTSTNLMMGVTIANQLLLTRNENTFYIWDTRGRMLSEFQLYSGCHNHFDISVGGSTRLVEIFYDGVARVNYLNINGDIIESYAIY